jgi:pimeloyl-ACP methyl ester carboxylesterase
MEELITHYYFPYPWYDQKITIPTYIYLKEPSFPVLILHGTDDKIVPIEEGQKLFHSIQRTRSSMVTIEHGTHDDLSEHNEYRKAIQNFLYK